MTKSKWILITVVYMGLIAALSLSPQKNPEGEKAKLQETISNFGHIPTYSILFFFWVRIFGKRINKTFLAAALIAIAYGILMEYLQSFVPGRFQSAGDVFRDSLGIAAAWIYLRQSLHTADA